MKNVILTAGILILACGTFPTAGLATSPKTFTGVVTGLSGSQVIFAATSAAKYQADTGNAQLLRKNGAAMQFSEIFIGDKIEVKGTLWSDNSISAASVRDLSLYTHTGTFSGKISTINPIDFSFTMDSKTYGSQTIHTNNFTSYAKNGSGATFKDLVLGMTASVKGVWDRSKANITATAVNGTYRLINLYFTGTLSMKNADSVTVIGNGNVIYGVDVSKATLQSKNGKPMALTEYKIGDSLRVWGKHISGGVAIVGTRIKNLSITK